MHEECKILYCFQRLKGRKQLEETGVGKMIVIKQNPMASLHKGEEL
jgi:hypothetical protein